MKPLTDTFFIEMTFRARTQHAEPPEHLQQLAKSHPALTGQELLLLLGCHIQP